MHISKSTSTRKNKNKRNKKFKTIILKIKTEITQKTENKKDKENLLRMLKKNSYRINNSNTNESYN